MKLNINMCTPFGARIGFSFSNSISTLTAFIFLLEVEISGKVYCCSEKAEPVRAGISRIWVLADFRRGRVASSLVDCMRAGFYLDKYLDKDEFAFSDPTLDGISFATKYMKSEEFLVYNR